MCHNQLLYILFQFFPFDVCNSMHTRQHTRHQFDVCSDASRCFGHTVFLKLRIGQFSDTQNPQWLFLSVQNYLMFNAFGEGYFCLLKMLLFLSIPSVYFIQFLREIYMEKVLQELFWVPFFGCPYRSNSTKIHLDVTLACKKQHAPLLFITLIVWDIAIKKMKEKSKV